MTRPTDDELEAMAAKLEGSGCLKQILEAAAMLRACKGRVRVEVDAALKRAEELASIHSDWSADEIEHYRRELASSRGALEPAPDNSEWNAAIEAAKDAIKAMRGPIDVPRTGKAAVFDDACESCLDVIRQLKKGPPHAKT